MAWAVSSYVALGDSFTAGEGCAEAERWPDLLCAGLRAANPGLAYANLAVNGATSAEVLAQVPAAIALAPDLVTVICGANDVLLSTRPDLDGYRERFEVILARLRAALPEAAMLTVTAPDSWRFLDLRPRTRARLDAALAELNEATRSLAAAHGILCLEMAGHPALSRRENFSDDCLHPSPRGHERAAHEIALALRERFDIELEPVGVGAP